MSDQDLAVIVNYSVDYPGTRPQVTVCAANEWNERNPHIPVAEEYDVSRQLGAVFNNRVTNGERVPDAGAARRVLRAHERRLGLPRGVLKAPG